MVACSDQRSVCAIRADFSEFGLGFSEILMFEPLTFEILEFSHSRTGRVMYVYILQEYIRP